jgi:hypothetical protein
LLGFAKKKEDIIMLNLCLLIEVTEECIRPVGASPNDRQALYATSPKPSIYVALDEAVASVKALGIIEAEIVSYRFPHAFIRLGTNYWKGTLPQEAQDWVARFHQKTALPISFELQFAPATVSDITTSYIMG